MLSTVTRQALAAKPFGTVQPRVAPRLSKCQMARKDSYMVEVEVAEDEPEDVAVRRYMKLVMQSRVVEKLRARRTKESKIEEYKRRFRERVEMRKAGIVDPTYDELYSAELDPKPFEDFFQLRDDEDPEGAYDGVGAGSDDIFGSFAGGSYTDTTRWGSGYPGGGYMNTSNSFGSSGGYMGGYMQ
ncbi:hypothetical protein HXX76_001196 [Chlamydomonas incerta]|uniref:Plastid ribosomal protein S21 n=1 Tax=Chlamydomonas incerta TaxID=51695 RepID=A0A836B1B4_CHLIN|nr:hypothetical protein HXX76_001196 [Chlamydomonas incerta]|eukprot:KAG2444443.1 hypothetical protein HXX76_001196 [Chlamydomonas incerta]